MNGGLWGLSPNFFLQCAATLPVGQECCAKLPLEWLFLFWSSLECSSSKVEALIIVMHPTATSLPEASRAQVCFTGYSCSDCVVFKVTVLHFTYFPGLSRASSTRNRRLSILQWFDLLPQWIFKWEVTRRSEPVTSERPGQNVSLWLKDNQYNECWEPYWIPFIKFHSCCWHIVGCCCTNKTRLVKVRENFLVLDCSCGFRIIPPLQIERNRKKYEMKFS